MSINELSRGNNSIFELGFVELRVVEMNRCDLSIVELSRVEFSREELTIIELMDNMNVCRCLVAVSDSQPSMLLCVHHVLDPVHVLGYIPEIQPL